VLSCCVDHFVFGPRVGKVPVSVTVASATVTFSAGRGLSSDNLRSTSALILRVGGRDPRCQVLGAGAPRTGPMAGRKT